MTSDKPIVLDIETAPLDLLHITVPEFKADSRLKDPEKIAAAKADKLAEWQSTLALHAPTCRVLVAGILANGKASYAEGDEAGILEWVWDAIDATPYPVVIGHNLRGFDLPMLVRRSWICGVRVPRIMDGKWLARRFVDTMEAWAVGTRDMISLDNLARALGVGQKNGKGGDFASLYAKDKAAALDYLGNDLRLTWACAERMGLTR